MTYRARGRLSRRGLLRAGGAMVGGAYLLGAAACAAGDDPGPGAGSGDPIQIPDPAMPLPEGEVTLRWIDSGDRKARFWDALFPAYERKHPNITVAYDPLPWAEINEVVPLGIRNQSAHDVFALPPAFSGAQAVAEGWVQPLDDYLPDIEGWKAAFPPHTFFEGVHVFDGKTYTFPFSSNQRHTRFLLYNKQMMEDAGYDPAASPLTWDEFRDAARKITEAGDGRAYGLILEGGAPGWLGAWVGTFAHVAGAPAIGGPLQWLDPRTGEYVFTRDEFRNAIELLIALREDGSIFPGVASLTEPEARARVPQGVVGMMVQGPWNIPQWEEEAPDFEFGVADHPAGDVAPVPLNYSPAGLANSVWLYSGSELGVVAGDLFSYIGSLAGQRAWSHYTGGVATPPTFPDAADAAPELSQAAKAAIDLHATLVVAPDPVIGNPAVSEVIARMQALSPNLGETIQGILVEEIDDPAAAMVDLKDRAEAELDRAIAEAQADGVDVSRDDLVFSNWDPYQDFGEADYR